LVSELRFGDLFTADRIQQRDVGLRNGEADWINRRGKRRFAHPRPEPFPEFPPLKAQRRFQARLENRSRCAGLSRAQPCIVASNRSRGISQPFNNVVS
jgi:hypothetical protein